MTASRRFQNMACWLAGLSVSFGLLLPLPAGKAEDNEVDLALVLAIDCSFSVDSREFKLQMDGLGRAFERPEIQKAIAQGPQQKIAVTAMEWSDDLNQKVILPWTIVSGAADAEEIGRVLMSRSCEVMQGGTSISTALSYAATLFDTAPSAERKVIDVSTDGRNNSGPPVSPVRDKVVARGITINGLTIINEWPTLNIYFENNVAGGADHFVIPANDYDAYADAILRKLLREITGPGIT